MIICPEHPEYEPEAGFGLAGGDCGPYTYCPVCCRILTKTKKVDSKSRRELDRKDGIRDDD